ncbi:MAG: hypothetical protein KAH34_06785 [Ketobacter sp.]|jgi:hypothetical protein|nr:hypothetical protein [Ketobacter sp.]MEC8810373.1 hypothetical protein [Pseudomonadota bacterium]HAU15060.1 hypothetical protein [Gammaproteobacteria bacterium]|tara:strand:+ start:1888 stop:3318 length:1431 start_codon:yes stop_codon:yes gene_type:complete
MKVDFKHFSPILITCMFLAPGIAVADKFDDAVNEYIKGYKECTEANTLRTSDLPAAKRKFDVYLKHLDRAKSIDSTILSTTQRDMDSNLRYCERVEVNIKRAEATPILEKGFTYCDTAKESLKNGDVPSAKSNMDEYKRYRDDAMIITDSIMEVFALASKVRACSRVEEKLAEAMKEENALVEKMNAAIQGYQTVLSECEKAKTTISSPKFSLDKLDDVNAMMNEAAKAKKTARQNTEAFTILKEQPTRPQSQELQKLVDSSAQCEGQTSEYIRTATKNRRALEKDIEDGVATLRAAQEACESAKKLSNRFVAEADISKAEASYNNSAALKGKVTNDAKLIATVKQYPSWSSSNQFSKLMNSTESCQKSTAASIKKEKAAFAQQQRQDKQNAARQAELEKERQRLAEEKARKEAEEAQKIAAQKKAEEEARRKAEAEARRAATLSDVPDDVEFNDDEFGDFGDDDDDRGGWTELVK